VIIDTPPLLAVADPAAVSRWADGVLLVSKAGASTRDAARKSAELLEKAGVRTVGVVVWGLGEGGRGAYGYYNTNYYYYSNYYYTSTDNRGRKSLDSGSKNVALGQEGSHTGADWMPVQTPGQRAASAVGKIFVGVLGFLGVLAVAAVIVYILGQYLGWDFGALMDIFR
jgi:hypothetical protein